MRRYAETFFRFWYIALLPIVVIPSAFFYLTRSSVPQVTVTASVWADQTTMKELSYTNTFNPPSQNLQDNFNQLVGSRSFDLAVAERSPVYLRRIPNKAAVGFVAASDLSRHVVVATQGPNLVTVSYITTDAALGLQVVNALLAQFSRSLLSFNAQQVSQNVAQFQNQLKGAKAQLAQAQQQYLSYIQQHNIASSNLNIQQIADPKLAALSQNVQSAQTNVQNLQQQVAQAQAQLSTNSLRVIDRPLASVSTSSKKKQLFTLIIPLVVAILISGAFIVTKTATDHSIRWPDEVQDLIGVPALGTVPFSRTLANNRRKDNKRSGEDASAAGASALEQAG